MKEKRDEMTVAQAREMLDRRFDDLENGRVMPIDGEGAYRLLMEKTEARRRGGGEQICIPQHAYNKRS